MFLFIIDNFVKSQSKGFSKRDFGEFAFTEIELTSALSRKIRETALSQKDGKAILSVFRTHVDDKSFVHLPIQPKHYSTAMNWIAEFNTSLRTLDALHLAIGLPVHPCMEKLLVHIAQ